VLGDWIHTFIGGLNDSCRYYEETHNETTMTTAGSVA
jgi:hypothetical protein